MFSTHRLCCPLIQWKQRCYKCSLNLQKITLFIAAICFPCSAKPLYLYPLFRGIFRDRHRISEAHKTYKLTFISLHKNISVVSQTFPVKKKERWLTEHIYSCQKNLIGALCCTFSFVMGNGNYLCLSWQNTLTYICNKLILAQLIYHSGYLSLCCIIVTETKYIVDMWETLK